MLASVSRRSGASARRHLASLESVAGKSKSADSIFAQAADQGSETIPVERRELVIREIAKEIKAGRTNPFFVVDLDSIVQQHRLWTSLLPRARPFYAVKCNPDARIVETLAALGAGFDCASPAEIQMALAAGARPGQDIIYANPVKHPAHIDVAHQLGVTTMTFDNVEELDKIAAIHPEARLVIRLKVDDSLSAVRLSRKFGASLDEVPKLAAAARGHGLAVDGIAFHVGSACGSASAYSNAVKDASRAFEMLEAAGHSPTLLDVGGGFPCDKQTNLAAVSAAASSTITFPEAAAAISEALDTYFPDPAVRVMGEPGRFYVGASHTLAVTVVGRRMVKETDDVEANKQMIYLSDGVYGAFNCIVFDGAKPQPAFDLLDQDTQDDLPVTPAEGMLPSNADQLLLCYGNAAPLADGMPTHPAGAAAHLPQSVQDGDALSPPVVGAESPVATLSSLTDAAEGGDMVAVSTSAAAQQVLGAASVNATAAAAGVAAATPRGKALAAKRRMLLTSLWGPTCDSCDLLTAEMLLPELQVGDALVFEGMGAYTSASSSAFNGFPQADKVYVPPASN